MHLTRIEAFKFFVFGIICHYKFITMAFILFQKRRIFIICTCYANKLLRKIEYSVFNKYIRYLDKLQICLF